MALPCLADLPPSVALGTVRSTTATGTSCGVMRWSRVDSDIPRLMAGLCVLLVRSAQPQTRARRRRLSSLWSRSTLTPPTKAAASLGAAEMGPEARRELALGLRSAEASLAATRGRSRRRRGGAGARETQRRRLPSRSALGALDLLSRLGPRAVTASMLRRSLPFQPTLLAISSSNARALPTSPPARHAGRQPSPADLVGQAVRLRRLPSPLHKCARASPTAPRTARCA